MDTFAVSLTSGAAIKELHLRYAFKFSLFFGFFQALMLLIGWYTGISLHQLVNNYSHWIAFGLLTLVGCKMIYESIILKEESEKSPLGFLIILGLAFATSIDALSVGISFSLLQYRILLPLLLLSIVTFTAAMVGIFVGDRFGSLCENKMAFIGGLILILIGVLNIIRYI
jgi:putative Mn2+ efflux pump MntP